MKPCEICGKPLNKGDRYCSRKCRALGRVKQIEITCRQCGVVFSINPARKGRAVYCSLHCKHESLRTDVMKICIRCGKEYWTDLNRSAKSKYCSKACHNADQKDKKLTKICAVCGKQYIVSSYAKDSLYCSHECQSKALTIKVEKTCEICGKKYLKCPAAARTSRYCSWQCQVEGKRRQSRPIKLSKRGTWVKLPDYIRDAITQRYPTEGPGKLAEEFGMKPCRITCIASKMNVRMTPEALKEVKRKTGLANIAERDKRYPDYMQKLHLLIQPLRNKYQPTKPERLLQSILTELKVDHEPGAIIKPSFVVDIKINQLIIQVDGEYWHGHPRFEPLSESQLKQRRRDASQDKFLSACGYKVVRLWESEISKDRVCSILQENSTAL